LDFRFWILDWINPKSKIQNPKSPWRDPMRRARRTTEPQGFFTGREFSRLSGAILMLVILAMLITSASRPSTWTWLTGEADERAAVAAQPDKVKSDAPPWKETIVPGPGADDPEERDAAEEQFEAVSDKADLAKEEMPSYWRLLCWARSQSFAGMRSHARRDVLYTKLWQQPEKYRGQLIALRLHLVRCLEHDAPENSSDFKEVFEVWGYTDESQSFPYVAVLVERPPSLKMGDKIGQEGTFVGYFLKTMAYIDGLGQRRAAPLLLGRIQMQEQPATAVSQPADAEAFLLTVAVGGCLLVVIAAGWYWRRQRRPSAGASDPAKKAETEVWLQTVQADNAIPLAHGNGRSKHSSSSPLSALFDPQHEHDEDG
jgi:hypothetical protein